MGYNTKNPIGSSDLRDVWDNADTFDKFMNGEEIEITDRTGKKIKGVAALQAIITSLDLGSFTFSDTASGLAGTTNGQYFRVPQGAGKGFIYYQNTSGAASEVGSTAGINIDEYLKNPYQYLQGLLSANHALSQSIAEITLSLAHSDDEIDGLRLDIIRESHETAKSLSPLDGFDPASTDKSVDELRLDIIRASHEAAKVFSPLEGFDPNKVISDDEINKAVENATTSNRGDGISVLPKPSSLVRIDLTIPSIPANKSDPDVQGKVKIISDGAIFNSDCLVSVQGASSAGYRKKNLNIEFIDTKGDDVKLKLGDILPLDTLTYKANWIDRNHIHNLTSYRLWDEVLNTRETLPIYDVDHALESGSFDDKLMTGATGFPMGYECVLFINGDFYGIGNIMSGKKKESYNISKSLAKSILIDSGDWTSLGSISSGVSDGRMEIKFPKKPTAATTQAIKDFDTFCTNVISGDSSGIPNLLDSRNTIDFLLFSQMIDTTDAISTDNQIKNMQLVSYDGKKWFFMPYDLDTVFGLQWNGLNQSDDPDYDRLQSSFWKGIIKGIGQDNFNSRYKELRDSGVFSSKNFAILFRKTQSMFTKDLFDQENEKWPEIGSLFSADINFSVKWASERLTFLDKYFSYTK